jgi:DNA polymerase elongation subunit (family B)
MHKFYTNVTTRGSKVLVREVNPNLSEVSVADKVSFSPCLYTLSQNAESQYRSIYDAPLDRHEFHDVSGLWDFKKRYRGVDDYPIYGDISAPIQYISAAYPNTIEFDFNLIRIFYVDIEVYTPDGKFPEPEEVKYPVSAISVYDSITDIYYQWGLEYDNCYFGEAGYDATLRHADKQVAYAGFQTEEELLSHFLKWWKKNCPDIMTGWNIEEFDIPYIVNRVNREFPDLKSSNLSPWGRLREDTINSFGAEKQTYKIDGVSILDYLPQYKKHSYTPRESYKLDYIAYAEKLASRKMSYDEAQGLHGLYATDYQKYIDYNIRDSELVKMLEDKRGILFLIVAAAYRSKCNFEDIVSPLRTWDAIIYNHLKDKNIFCPPTTANRKDKKYEGAFVKEPQLGWFDWVVSVDLASLYPSLMRQINISPEMLVRGVADWELQQEAACSVDDLINKTHTLSRLKEPQFNYSFAANGTYYRKDEQGFLPYLLELLYLERKADKGRMLEAKRRLEQLKHDGASEAEIAAAKKDVLHWHTMQYAKKILLNSAYGALGNQYFRMYDVRLAEAVTLSGQVAIQWIERKLNEYFNLQLNTEGVDYVIYIDTDGMYLNMKTLVEKFMPDMTTEERVDGLDKFFAGPVAEFITASYQELFEYMNNREQLMFMDRECIADKAIWSNKKRYMLNVYDNEGVRYDEPKLKVMGYAYKTTAVPEICRDKIAEIMPCVIHGTNDDLIVKIEEFRKEWKAMPADVIAKPSGVNGIKKYARPHPEIYAKGTLAHIRGSILFNHLHDKLKLGGVTEKIQDGGKIKWVELKMPNPIGDNVIAFPDYLPKELGLDAFVDSDAMFEKRFLNPLREVTDAIGWNTEKVSTLNFFIARQQKANNA